MKNLCSILFMLITLLGGVPKLMAQQTVIPAGGNATGTNGNVSYTTGQFVYTIANGVNGSVTHGVQQPYEVSVVTSSTTLLDMQKFFSVYPVPATDYLTIDVDQQLNPENGKMKVFLSDLNGKLLHESEVTGKTTNISMIGLAPSTYFVRIIEGKNELINFKIVKR